MILFKIFFSPSNQDILPHLLSPHLAVSWTGNIEKIASAFFKEIFHEKWCGIWIFSLLLLIVRCPIVFFKENVLPALFFILYLFLLTVIYSSTSGEELSWWLSSSLPRIYFYLLPSAIFFSFFVFWKKDHD